MLVAVTCIFRDIHGGASNSARKRSPPKKNLGTHERWTYGGRGGFGNSHLTEVFVVLGVGEHVRRRKVDHVVMTAVGPLAEPSGRGQVHVLEASDGPAFVADFVLVSVAAVRRVRVDDGQHHERDLDDQQPNNYAVDCHDNVVSFCLWTNRLVNPPKIKKKTRQPAPRTSNLAFFQN